MNSSYTSAVNMCLKKGYTTEQDGIFLDRVFREYMFKSWGEIASMRGARMNPRPDLVDEALEKQKQFA